MANQPTRLRQPHSILKAMLDQPDLVARVQQMAPQELARTVARVGLEDAGEIVALATTEQLKGVFDLDLWKSPCPGVDGVFDASRFGLWLQVLMEAGAPFAAKTFMQLDEDFVTLALSRLVLVLDMDNLAPFMTGTEDDQQLEKALEGPLNQEFDAFRVIARDGHAWEAVVNLVAELDAHHNAYAQRILQRLAFLASEYIEDNGGLYEVLTSEEMLETDVAAEREERRERQGFVPPSAAASFLEDARISPLQELVDSDGADHITRMHFRTLDVERNQHNLHLVKLNYLANVLMSGASFHGRPYRAVEAARAVLDTCALGKSAFAHADNVDTIKLFRVGWHLQHRPGVTNAVTAPRRRGQRPSKP